jgi:hypothetical protein
MYIASMALVGFPWFIHQNIWGRVCGVLFFLRGCVWDSGVSSYLLGVLGKIFGNLEAMESGTCKCAVRLD